MNTYNEEKANAKKKDDLVDFCLVICLVVAFGVSAFRNANTDPDPEEMNIKSSL